MKRIVLVAVAATAFMLITEKSKAQDLRPNYTTALGVKVWGDGGGVSIKHFLPANQALEGIGYFWQGGARFTGLYEFHFDFPDAPGLKWYVGPGVHAGFYNQYYFDRRYPDNYPRSSGTYVGIDGVIGLDYKFTGAPINLSLDWQPSFEFGADRGFIGSWGGLGIRYTF